QDSLSAGQEHTCLARAGLLYCWGDNSAGQLGTGDKQPRTTPTLVPGVDGVVSVATGAQHTCVLLSDGGVACFGSNALGQSGRAGGVEQPRPARVALPARGTARDGA